MTAKAIQTRYNGYHFRSRTEARWAVFFDTLGIKWEYEKEGYELPSGPYLPDFWLPEYEVWLEIKGAPPTDLEIRKCEDLRDETGKAVLLAEGIPGTKPFRLFCWNVGDGSCGTSDWDCIFGLDVNGEFQLFAMGASGNRELYLDSAMENLIYWDEYYNFGSPRIFSAFNAAKAARFEFSGC